MHHMGFRIRHFDSGIFVFLTFKFLQVNSGISHWTYFFSTCIAFLLFICMGKVFDGFARIKYKTRSSIF